MEFRVLGSVEVVAGGKPLVVRGQKQRTLLAALLAQANEVVATERLIDALWGERPPETARAAVQVHISQLRKLLGAGRVITNPHGYLLRVEPGELDSACFERLVAEAQAATGSAAAAKLREALALWRGSPFEEFQQHPFAGVEISRLEELRLTAEEQRIDEDLALGLHARVLPELEATVRKHPYRERSRGQLMLALYRSGRQAEALDAYRAARASLVEELGIEPGPELRRLERAILDQDPELERALAAPVPAPPKQVSGLLPRPTSFVGRRSELREIRALLGLGGLRLLTLTGTGGVGKTRLAAEVIADLGAECPDGVRVVELAPISDPNRVAAAIADELGLGETPGEGQLEKLISYLRDRRALIVLDNFEHVLAAAPLVRDLLASALGVKVLVTSRAPLAVPEERVYRVTALELPDPSRRTTLDRLRRIEAIRLFVDRARTVRPDFELSETNAGSVAELCVRLDGLPLALELAAARSNLLSPRALLERLDSRLDLLRAPPGSGLTERQWTLRRAVEWSYELLHPNEQQLFTSLGVFVAGFTLSAAEVVADQPDLDIVEGVDSLFRNNLLTTELAASDEPRLGMLETIREYAQERLAERGDGDAVRRRHAGFYLLLAEEAEAGLLGPHQREWLDRLDNERDNIRAALTWARDAGEAEIGLRIGSALWRFWQLRSSVQEARDRLEELLALGSGSTGTRARAQTTIANLTLLQGDCDTARRLLEESLTVHRREGDAYMVAYTLGVLGIAALTAGEINSALARTREALEVARAGHIPYIESAALWHLGVCLAARGDLDDAERAIEEAIDLARRLGNARSVGGSLKSLAGLALMRGDHARARRLFDESLTIHRSLDDAWGISNSLSNLAFLALEAGDDETARVLLSEALAIEREIGDHPVLANALELSARLAAREGNPALSLRLYARAALLRETVGARLEYELGLPDPAPNLEHLRSLVGGATFEEQWERGRSMTLLEAIDQVNGKQRALEPTHAPHTDEQRTTSPS